jgi:hypothetical protein
VKLVGSSPYLLCDGFHTFILLLLFASLQQNFAK